MIINNSEEILNSMSNRDIRLDQRAASATFKLMHGEWTQRQCFRYVQTLQAEDVQDFLNDVIRDINSPDPEINSKF